MRLGPFGAGLAGLLIASAAAAQPVPDAASPAASPASAIPFKQDREAGDHLGLRAAGALLICLLVGGGAIYLLTKRRDIGTARQRGGARLRVLESKRLGPRSGLLLVRWDDEDLLIAQGDGRIDLLARKPTVDPS